MRIWPKYHNIAIALLSGVLAALPVELAHAHLMEAQHGTLNFIDNSVFLVLSLPISAFEGLDDNTDGKVSMIEFNAHRSAIVESVQKHINLSDDEENLPLKGTMLLPVTSHNSPEESISQLNVMGRFNLNDADGVLHFDIGLYGKQASEKLLEITATRATDRQQVVFQLTPASPSSLIFPAD